MNIHKSKALVLKAQDFRDTSSILTLFTQRFGKIKVLAKGVKSAHSRMAGNLQQFAEVEIVFYHKEETGLHLVSQSELLKPTKNIYQSLSRLSYASAAVELLDRLTTEEENHPGLFSILGEALGEIDQAEEEKLPVILWAFALRLSANLGYAPNLAACSVCSRREFSGDYLLFSVEEGGIICPACASSGSHYLKLSLSSWRLMKEMLKGVDLENLPGEPKNLQEISEIILSLLEYHAHSRKSLNSMEFLQKL